MIIARRIRLASPLLVLTLGVGAGCQDEGPSDPGPVQDDGGTSGTATGSEPEPEPATSEAGDTTGDADGTGADEGSSSGEAQGPSDPNLDRSAPNILDDPNLCGYPGPGQYGYGGIIDQNRFPNFVLEDCEGNQREFAEFFCERDDEYGDYNHAFVVVFEAMWCPYCNVQSSFIASTLYPAGHPQGLEVVSLLVENSAGNAPSNGDCSSWRMIHDLDSPILKDPGMSVYQLIGNAPNTVGLPFTYILDANANVRFAGSGEIDHDYFIDKINEVLATPYAPE